MIKQQNDDELIEILFKATVGISDMAAEEIVAVKAWALKTALGAMPEKTYGKKLNIAASATALPGVDSHIVKIAQGEGWDQALHSVEANLKQAFNGGDHEQITKD